MDLDPGAPAIAGICGKGAWVGASFLLDGGGDGDRCGAPGDGHVGFMSKPGC